MKTIIYDIDGTLANIQHLIPLWETDKEQFFERLGEAKTIKETHVLFAVHHLFRNYKIAYYTARPERTRGITEKWIKDNLGGFCTLLMRADNDERPDEAVKIELLEKAGLTPDKVLFVVEDRVRVVKALRAKGYFVMDVAGNDY
jgi:FMN phosphatase YigB (HAD superfamily)